ncbi:hypothetical protein GCM10010160_02190 [Acrocarpospora corrugata]
MVPEPGPGEVLGKAGIAGEAGTVGRADTGGRAKARVKQTGGWVGEPPHASLTGGGEPRGVARPARATRVGGWESHLDAEHRGVE